MTTHRARPVLIAGIATIGAIGAVTGSVVSAASPAKAHSAQYGFSGHAFGSQLQATPDVSSGRSALLTLGCTIRTGVDKDNATEDSQTSSVGHVGSVATSTGTRAASEGAPASVSTATVNGFNLLGGALTATAVKSTSTASHDGTSRTTGKTTFTNLRILGRKIDSTPAPNKTYRIKGVGTVVLNQQKSDDATGTSGMTVNGLELTLAHHNPAGLPTGTRLVVAHANAATHPVGELPLHGTGYGTAVLDNDTVTSGQTFSEPMPCSGTDGKTLSNPGSGVSLGTALQTGDIVSTANGSNTDSSDTGSNGATVHNVSLLGGAVTAKLIKAETHVVDNDGDVTTTEQGSRFVGLVVDGKKVPADVKPNTKISLGPLGSLWLNRVTRTDQGITVHMIDLHLKKADGDVAQGSDIVVANADTGVRR